MSPLPREPETALSAAELNARIRELWADGQLPDARRPEYEALVLKWAAAALERVEHAA
ncbi:hypothetical protein [Streptomyces albipurpureus]|uniref:Uncharacterized protein n=1 Tax=Streptomyces albipurpureus TaxID=2897419 RepID=A0ABT0UTN9_9ACTN|nr:hypothetical protein [Streptomyces sp. CWNU-1]MCM2391611.1 hypothetical protein [Streptomyces sp. CWNU-1]